MATLKDVSKEILSELSKTSLVGRKVGSDLHTLTLDRIFTKGIASNGKDIGTYSPVTISIKKSERRFTSSRVNLRGKETLVKSYVFEGKGNGAEIGFLSATKDGVTNTEKIEKLEKQYGDIFDLTASEESEIDNIIDDFLDKIFK